MHPRGNWAKFQHLAEFERERFISLLEEGCSCRAIAARVQRNSSTVMRVWKKLTEELQVTRKTRSGRPKVTPGPHCSQ
ncbi:hypothetical protein TNCV_579321 [Trichonephila clavipes]|nr:hypothetical protein TNCV_579321 [Trichonephila clavipes]